MHWDRLTLAQAVLLLGLAVLGIATAALWKPLGLTKEVVIGVMVCVSLSPFGAWLMRSPVKTSAQREPSGDSGESDADA